MTAASRESIENRIVLCRGRPVLPASDLAALYGLSAGAFLERVQRHGPLPGEFAFPADLYEPPAVPRNRDRGWPLYVFTEYGAFAAAYLMGSEHAVAKSLEVLRAFVRFRRSNGGEHAPDDSWPAGATNSQRAGNPASGRSSVRLARVSRMVALTPLWE